MNLTYKVHPIKTRYQGWTNYCYIIEDIVSRSAIVVDPSWELSKITTTLSELGGIKGSRIDTLSL